jgi:hypothetical protein
VREGWSLFWFSLLIFSPLLLFYFYMLYIIPTFYFYFNQLFSHFPALFLLYSIQVFPSVYLSALVSVLGSPELLTLSLFPIRFCFLLFIHPFIFIFQKILFLFCFYFIFTYLSIVCSLLLFYSINIFFLSFPISLTSMHLYAPII